jgi:hypothetical protein
MENGKLSMSKLIGEKFGRLTVLSDTGKRPNKRIVYLCACDCGNTKEIMDSNLKNQKVPSCGCHTKELYQNRSWGEPGNNSFRYLFNRNQNNAKNRNYEFTLNFEQFKILIQKKCFYCGSEPKPYNYYLKNDGSVKKMCTKVYQETIDRSWINANGIDRVDNNKGYTVANSAPCCEQCNRAKLDWTHNEFMNWIKVLTEYQFGKN